MNAASERYLVLTSASGVDDALASDFVNLLRGSGHATGDPRRLARGAVEIGFDGDAPDGDAIVSMGLCVGADANIVSAAGRVKRVLLADMDSTIIGVECIDELADFAGVKAQVAGITEAAMRGDLDFEGALTERVRLLAGLDEAVLLRCHEERVSLNPGARVLVRTMAGLGAATALVSGGFEFFAGRVAAEAGFAESRANGLVSSDGKLTGEVRRPILGREAKLAALREITARGGWTPQDAIAVGDGANDREMVAAAGLGVAYRARTALVEVADARLDHSDLTAILALQGVPESEWLD